MLSEAWPNGVQALSRARRLLQAAVAQRVAASEQALYLIEFPELSRAGDVGCDGHPNLAAHAAMAAELTGD